MSGSLNILMVATECSPFAKTGGLGDVVGTLPEFLKRSGNDARVVIPLYSLIDRDKYDIHPVIEKMIVGLGNQKITCNVYQTISKNNLPVYFIDYEPYFGRAGIYYDNYFNDYADNPARFIFLSRAALQLCLEINFKPDIIHSNDWHTAIIPAYLKRLYNNDPMFRDTASVLTIHNLAYQGIYSGYYFDYTGLYGEDFTPDKFEYYGAINLLKGGIHFADMINTVSPGYAKETKTPAGGFGLDYFMNKKGEDYIGILNGVDYDKWDPYTDRLIPANFSPGNIGGKLLCKRALQYEMGLTLSDDTPVVGVISRLVEQKGLYLLKASIENILNSMNVQFVILGAGEPDLETYFSTLNIKYPGKAGSFIGYNERLSHLIEAGSDFFLMPSIYEPCGLNQIYSQKYGTLPVVHATGGLNDTVENYNQKTGEGTGFKFNDASGEAIYNTLQWALDTYSYKKFHFEKLISNAMDKHYSWEESAEKYVHLYRKALEKKNKNVGQPLNENL